MSAPKLPTRPKPNLCLPAHVQVQPSHSAVNNHLSVVRTKDRTILDFFFSVLAAPQHRIHQHIQSLLLLAVCSEDRAQPFLPLRRALSSFLSPSPLTRASPKGLWLPPSPLQSALHTVAKT